MDNSDDYYEYDANEGPDSGFENSDKMYNSEQRNRVKQKSRNNNYQADMNDIHLENT